MSDNNLSKEAIAFDRLRDMIAWFADAIEKLQVGDDGPGEFHSAQILTGRVIGMAGDDVVIDVGLKAEGLININEFGDVSSIKPGDEIQVVLEDLEGAAGHIQISKHKADHLINWRRIIETTKVGDVVQGKVVGKIKSGLLVDIGVPVLIPPSQIDVRRPRNLYDFIGRTVQAEILMFDEQHRSILVSRRKLIEAEREILKKSLLARISTGDIVKGVVMNILDYGAFIDIGGIDGLLHITDMSCGCINHPSEILGIDDEIEVIILNIDYDNEKIALGLKQMETAPQEMIESG